MKLFYFFLATNMICYFLYTFWLFFGGKNSDNISITTNKWEAARNRFREKLGKGPLTIRQMRFSKSFPVLQCRQNSTTVCWKKLVNLLKTLYDLDVRCLYFITWVHMARAKNTWWFFFTATPWVWHLILGNSTFVWFCFIGILESFIG